MLQNVASVRELMNMFGLSVGLH